LKFLSSFRIVTVVGAAWGAAAHVPYFQVVTVLPLSIGPLVASTVLFPSSVSDMITANAFKLQVGFRPFPIYAYVPNPFTETLGTAFYDN
jgi:hypothetical protein